MVRSPSTTALSVTERSRSLIRRALPTTIGSSIRIAWIATRGALSGPFDSARITKEGCSASWLTATLTSEIFDLLCDMTDRTGPLLFHHQRD